MQFGKLSAAILDGLWASLAIQIVLVMYLDKGMIDGLGSWFSIYMVWGTVFLICYWVPKVWQEWGLMLVITVLGILFYYLARY